MREAQKFRQYAEFAGEGGVTRSQAANHFQVSKSTATYHLERAVLEGVLIRFYSWTDEFQTGWAYKQPGRELPLPFEDMAEPPDSEPDSQEFDWLEYGEHEAEQDMLYTMIDHEISNR